MGASSKKNAADNKSKGPGGNDKPGKGVAKCKLKDKPPKKQTVEPQITVVDPFRWFHDTVLPDRNLVGTVTLKATKRDDNLGYKGNGSLSADNTNVQFYSDSKCKKKIDPAAAPITYKFGSLCSGVTLYYKGGTVGTTNLTLTLAPAKDDRITVLPPVDGPVEVRLPNIVTPKIELEYKIVLFDRKLHEKQQAGETKIFPGATYIEVSATQTIPALAYTKTGKLEFTPARVDAFTDEKCTTKLDRDLTAAELLANPPTKIWLRGKTEGKFKAKLTLADPADEAIRLDKNPAEQDMGVLQLELKLHQHDITKLEATAMQVDPDTDPETTYYTNLKNKALPDQKLMTDAEKIGAPTKDDAANPGRLLHVQNAGNFGRSKLIVAKINPDSLPPGTDDYDIVLNFGRGSAPDSGAGALKPEDFWGGALDNPVSGSITLYDAEVDGGRKDSPSFKISALKAAEQTLWVEGSTEVDQPCAIRLDIGMDRANGGLAKDVKRNGDWTRYTVVKIDEVKLDYTATAGQAAAWDATEKEYYINFKAGVDGRKIKIAAKLTKALKNVALYFMLAPDKDNKKTANWGVDLPTTWKWKDIAAEVKHLDKADRKNFLHLSEKTDVDGKASKELTLSRFGGDKFQPAAYILQDPHLAKYVEGDTDLEKRKPVLATDKITVWRKFWYREVKVAGIMVADFGNAADTYDDVRTTMEAAPVVEMPRTTADGISPKVIYPKHMIRYYRDTGTNQYVNSYPGDAGDALIVGDNNESRFMSQVTADPMRPVEIPIMNVHGLWIADGVTGTATTGADWVAFPGPSIKLVADKKLLSPPLQGGNLLHSGTWKACRWNTATNAMVPGSATNGTLQAAHVTLDPQRNDPKAFLVTPPVPPGANVRVQVTLTLRGAASFLGTSYADGIVNCYTPNDLVDFINTINHEIGHSFKQTAKTRPAGVPVHPHQYDLNGSHCRYTDDSCLMFESGPQRVHLDRFCPVCHPYVLVQEMRNK